MSSGDRVHELAGIISQALDQAADAVAIFTADEDLVGSEIVFVNEAFVKMTGYTREALVGHSALLLMGKRPALEDVRASLGARQAGPYFAVARRTRSDGSEYEVEVRVRAITDATGRTTHYALSHRGIRSAATELAVLEDARCDDLTTKLGDALEAAADAQDVIGELGMLARTDAAPRVMDVHEVPAVHANPAALARTFAQLIQNAAAAIPPFFPAANTITLKSYEDIDGNVVVEISDTGVGMAEDVVHRVFAPFFTTRSGYAAEGLGLTIARADVLAAGGSIGVESIEGRGSRFTVRLPAVGGPVSTLPLTPTNDLPLRRVLVASSDAGVARQLRAYFEDERTHVDDTTIEEAAGRLARGDAYDLIVSDARDPNASAFRARLAEAAPDALMKMFEITADTLPEATTVKKRESSVRLSVVGGTASRVR